ncbi:hypothetical protein HanXRQr2_Chr04g0171161 [Helianthus annuus]|uniref:Uncharacterized protein n=1 Tax=Helianthus annuus TaxID=4232 RepID=A0A9K3NRW4_HELAN|nr:hypothetical protein HanXRQr2_Chr04g0171161 [Helianthus annuus]
MAKVIVWRFERSERRFILKFSDRRRVKVRTINAILGMSEGVQKDILDLGVPRANDCERIRTVIRRLERKFQAEDDDDDDDDDDIDNTPLPTVSSWVVHEEAGTVEVTYQHGVKYSLSMEEMLNTERLYLLEQLCDLALSNDARSMVAMIFKYRLRQRRDEMMALYANLKYDNDESEKK